MEGPIRFAGPTKWNSVTQLHSKFKNYFVALNLDKNLAEISTQGKILKRVKGFTYTLK